MRLYRLSNKNRHGSWIFAESIQLAKEVFLEEGFVRRIENIKFVEDQTDFYRPTTDLDKVTVVGSACMALPSRSWCVSRNGKLVRDLQKGIGV
jgi:hypothetical protein